MPTDRSETPNISAARPYVLPTHPDSSAATNHSRRSSCAAGDSRRISPPSITPDQQPGNQSVSLNKSYQ